MDSLSRGKSVLTGPNVILTLKIAVGLVTILLLSSLVALFQGRYRLHGRINTVFFVLTATALLGLEVITRVVNPAIFHYIETDPQLRRALLTHLCFSLPATAIMPLMLWTGYTHRRRIHLGLAVLFGILWIGTFITGIFFLPHEFVPGR